MAYADARDYEEALKNLKVWAGEYSTIVVGSLQVVAKDRSLKKTGVKTRKNGVK